VRITAGHGDQAVETGGVYATNYQGAWRPSSRRRKRRKVSAIAHRPAPPHLTVSTPRSASAHTSSPPLQSEEPACALVHGGTYRHSSWYARHQRMKPRWFAVVDEMPPSLPSLLPRVSAVERAARTDAGLVPWRTDAHRPPARMCMCALWALCAVVGVSVSSLGLARDAIALQMGASLEELQAALTRAKASRARAGALVLCRAHVSVSDVLCARAGVFLVGAYLRGHPHLLGYNAGTRMLYLGPWVWEVSEAHVADPGALVHELRVQLGLEFEEPLVCRQVYLCATYERARELPYNTPRDLDVAAGGLSRSAKRRRRMRGGSRKAPRVEGVQ